MTLSSTAQVYNRTPAPQTRSTRAVPRPFLKWVGGKGRLLKQYRALFPSKFNRYHEPFLGGGAVYFELEPRKASLTDTNAELVNCFTMVRDRVDEVIAALQQHHYEKSYYYLVRARGPESLSPVEQAARMIFLNRTGFNGLYRLNKSGRFNVPFGRYVNPKICDEPNLRACSERLSGVHIDTEPFQAILERAEPRDFVYFDPPYHPLSTTANFTQYSAGGFTESDQVRLAVAYKALTLIGVKAMLSNSDTPLIRELYKDFDIRVVKAGRAINSNAARRGKINELVILNYTPL